METSFKLDVPIDWEPLERKLIEESKKHILNKTVEALSMVKYYEGRSLLESMRRGQKYPTYPHFEAVITELIYELVKESVDRYINSDLDNVRREIVECTAQRILKRKAFADVTDEVIDRCKS